MLKPSVLLALAFATLSAASAQSDVKITYQCNAKAIGTVISEIAKSSGLNLSVAGTLRDLPIILDVNGLSSEDFMKHISTVTNAEWVGSASSASLTRTPKKVAEMQQRERQLRTEILAKAIAEQLNTPAAKQTWDRETVTKLIAAEKKRREDLLNQIQGAGSGSQIMIQTVGDSQGLNPVLLAAYSILRQLPPSLLASIQPGERVVYSNRPTQMQGALPFRAEPVMEQFRNAHNLLASVADTGGGVDPMVKIQGGLDLEAKPINGPLSKVLLIFQRMSGRDPGVTLEVRFADSQGKIVGNTQLWIGPGPTTASEQVPGSLGNATLSELNRDLALALSPAGGNQQSNTMAIAMDGDFVMLGDSGMMPKAISPVLKAILDKPATNEPLSYFVSEAILALGKARNQQVIAVVPDTMMNAMLPMARTGNVGFDELTRPGNPFGIEVSSVGPVTLISPANPAEASRSHVNRGQLQRLIDSAYSRRYASLLDLSSYAVSMPAQFDDRNLDVTILNTINPMVAKALDGGPTQRQFMRLIGTLPDSQKVDRSPQTQFMFGNMRPDQRQIVHQLIYGPGGMSVIGRGQSIAMSVTSGSRPGERYEPHVPSLADEPTEVMPTGIPANGIFQIGCRMVEGLFGLFAGEGFGKFTTANELGLAQGMAQNNGGVGAIKAPQFEKYQLADIYRIEASVRAGAIGRSANFTDGEVRQGSLPVTMAGLPEGIRAAIQKATDQAANMKFNFGTGPQKPPL